MQYKRIENEGDYKKITTVDDEGNYEQIARWGDGLITSHYKTTLQKMGWNSVEKFLEERKGFTST